MKISIYELLGLVKDGKAPKKIKYREDIYEYKNIEEGKGYVSLLPFDGLKWLTNRIDIDDADILNDTVEILEEEKKIPEKLDLKYDHIKHIAEPFFKEEILMYCDNLQNKINSIIDYLKSKGE